MYFAEGETAQLEAGAAQQANGGAVVQLGFLVCDQQCERDRVAERYPLQLGGRGACDQGVAPVERALQPAYAEP